MTASVTACLWVAGQPVVRLDRVPRRLAVRVARRLGAKHGPTSDAVDIVVRGPRSPETGPVGIRIGRADAAASGDSRLTLFHDGGQLQLLAAPWSTRVEAEWTGSGGGVSVIAGLAQLSLLRRGIVPVHAAVVRHRGRLVAAAGWSRGGKTAALAAMLDDDAAVLTTEWTYLPLDRSVLGADHPIRLRASHLRGSPAARRLVQPARQLRVITADLAASMADSAGAMLGGAGRPVRRLASVVERHSYVDVPVAPPLHFDEERLALVVLVHVSEGGMWTGRLDRGGLVARLAAAFEEDLDPVTSAERRFAFAFGRLPGWVQNWRRQYRDDLAARLEDASGWELRHPDPASLSELAVTIAGLTA